MSRIKTCFISVFALEGRTIYLFDDSFDVVENLRCCRRSLHSMAWTKLIVLSFCCRDAIELCHFSRLMFVWFVECVRRYEDVIEIQG